MDLYLKISITATMIFFASTVIDGIFDKRFYDLIAAIRVLSIVMAFFFLLAYFWI
jgi:hypothetical protein